MTILEDIQSAAVDAKSDLGTILRKCKLLAARLDNQPFQEWVTWESNGYPENVTVPEYRIMSLTLKGHFTGWGGASLQYAPIPMASIPKKTREFYQRYQCRQSVASIESLIGQATDGSGMLQVNTGDLALLLGQKVYVDMNCLQAWAEIGAARLVEILNSVRNKALDFTLAIQKESPTAGEFTVGNKAAIENERVTQIFHTTVYDGGSANFVGTANDSNVTFNIAPKDFPALQKVLEENKVDKSDIIELKGIVESETVQAGSEKFGPKVSKWIGKMTEKAADGSWKVGLATAGNLLARAIAKFYGIGE